MSKVIGPSEQFQHGANQLLLGDRLVRVRGTAQRLVPLPHAVPERLERIGDATDSRHSGVARMPSVRKYSVNR